LVKDVVQETDDQLISYELIIGFQKIVSQLLSEAVRRLSQFE